MGDVRGVLLLLPLNPNFLLSTSPLQKTDAQLVNLLENTLATPDEPVGVSSGPAEAPDAASCKAQGCDNALAFTIHVFGRLLGLEPCALGLSISASVSCNNMPRR